MKSQKYEKTFNIVHNSKKDGSLVKNVDMRNLSDNAINLIVNSKKRTISRNSKCPCGSNKRFKNCCMHK